MNAIFEKYLNSVDRHLKPLPISERTDIIKEMKSCILEMEKENLSADQILERLGSPKELAKAYLADLISEGKGFDRNKFLTVCAFYSLTGFSGLFVIPILGIIAPAFLLCGVIAPIAGFIKFTASLLGYEVPYIMFQFGSVTLSPSLGFLFSIMTGIVLCFLGKMAWNLLLNYMKAVSRTKKILSV